MDPPETERRFGSGNPPLSRRGLLHSEYGIRFKLGWVETEPGDGILFPMMNSKKI
jgi:hypothetical protein